MREVNSIRALSPSVRLLKQALKDRGIRQQDLAQRTGLSKDHVSRILLGKVAFPKSRDTLTALAKALELDPLLFVEYRQSVQILPDSTRRLCAHLKAQGISQQEFIRRIPQYSEGHLQLILRGGSPFPRDPETIALFAEAAEASPYLFPEFLPLTGWHERLATAAAMALDRADQGVFLHLLGKIEKHFSQLEASEQTFADRLLTHFLTRAFAATPLPADPELDDALTYLPPLTQYQSEVQAILRRLYERGLSVPWLASAAGCEEDVLYAIANGQMKLKAGPLQDTLFSVLELKPGDAP